MTKFYSKVNVKIGNEIKCLKNISKNGREWNCYRGLCNLITYDWANIIVIMVLYNLFNLIYIIFLNLLINFY